MEKESKVVENKKITMKELFKGYSKYSEEEYLEIWKEAIIVVDANILLNFYRLSNGTRMEIYEILKSLKKRLWIPYQVAYEYFKNKEKVIVDANNDIDKLLADSNSCFSTIINKVNEKSSKRLKCKEELLQELKKSEEKIKGIIIDDRNNNKENASEENIEKLIFELFDNSIGSQIVGEEYENIKSEGLKRFKEQIPPGYKDESKEENGDYYIFYAMMKYAKENKKHIIFVTDDVKEDWFIKRFGEIKSGDSRVLNEFYKETRKLLLIYTSDGFINSYQKNIKNPRKVDSKIIDELVANRSANYEQEFYISYNNYKVKIRDIFKRLEEFENLPTMVVLKMINSLQEILIDINLFDYYISILVKLLKEAIRRKKREDAKNLLEDLKEYIYGKPRFNKLTNNKCARNLERFDYKLVNEFNSDYNSIESNIFEIINKLEKITDDKLKNQIMSKISAILKELNTERNLEKNDRIGLIIELEGIKIEIENWLNENVV